MALKEARPTMVKAKTIFNGGHRKPLQKSLTCLTFGCITFACVQWGFSMSGAHLNPAITLGILLTGRLGWLRGFLYIGSQCFGALGGSFLLQVLAPRYHHGHLGTTYLFPGGVDPTCQSGDCIIGNVKPWQGFGIELMVSLVLVLVYLSATDPLQSEDETTNVPLAMGLAVAGVHLMAFPYTGCGANPARSLGPAVIAQQWDNHWVYWAGPLAGGMLAACLHRFVFSSFRRHQRHQYDITATTDPMKMHNVN
ncbi:aquaporin AQPAe.a-like isoform X2 [Tigriopus californicus]|uniref:aquaporin AQPAe.a-like isoform X2 n=1 Tax=Tigriopus californicus TaxID=6832 RepID=UPI0027DA264A|nr:aquaporin AQPAe.a-like isoform X2 [Tigriopus californicus]